MSENPANSSKVCLIRPPAVDFIRFASASVTLPLGLGYIAGALERAQAQLELIDAVAVSPNTYIRFHKGFLIGLPHQEIVDRIPPDILFVGITALFTHEWPAIVHLVDLIKRRYPNLPVVIGGESVTAMPEFSLATSKADIIILGEGEETIVELYHALKAKNSLSEIQGLGYRDGGKIVINPRRLRRKDVDDIPPPAWHLFDLKVYHENRFAGGLHTGKLTIPILATRGCPYQCTYCSAPNMWMPEWIPRDPVKVVDEIESYVQRYGARNFPFQDLTAIIRRDWIVRFCQEILDRRLEITWQFPTGTRCEVVDVEVASLLRRSGMISMSYAPESGSEMTRKIIKKKMSTEKLFASIRAAVSEKLNIALFTVIGFPHDSEEAMRENLVFVEKAAQMGVNDLAVGYYMALPGTELFQHLYDSGKIVLDKVYFRHILHNLALIPLTSYCANLGPLSLTYWKFRTMWKFYASRTEHSIHRGAFATLRRAVSGLFSKSPDESRLQTAFRTGILNTWYTIKSLIVPRWIPRAQEDAMISNWDAIYREIRKKMLASGVISRGLEDPRDMAHTNIIPALRREHAATNVLELESVA